MTISAPLFATTSAELRDLFGQQRTAFLREGPPSAETRRNRLDRLLVAVLGAADELTRALNADFGHRPRAFSLMADVLGGVGSISHLRDHLEGWMAPGVAAGSEVAGIPTTVDVAPLGVVGVIGPWNFPIGLVLQPAAEAIAAGNRVMIKFSDVDTRTGAVLANAIAEEFDPSELLVINGGIETATAFSALPFDHLFFTGSPAVGKIVQRAAADNLTPVTLELGGKNPAVIAPDADLATAAERLAISRLVNGGQVCLCPDDVFVPASQEERFVEDLRNAFLRLYPAYPTNPAITSIVNDRNYARVTGLVDDAVQKGATAIVAVSDDDAALLPDPVTRRIGPTLLRNVTEQMAVSSEEVFGPVISIRSYVHLDEVIDYLNERPSPLVAYWYGDDSADFQEFRRRTQSGGITRNDFAVHLTLPDVPFGGVGQSGMGSYHGKTGFDTFSHRRAVAESLIPGGMAGQLGSAGSLAEATAELLMGQAEELRQQSLLRLGR